MNRDPHNNDSRRDRKYLTGPFYHINSHSEVKVKIEPEDLDFDNKLTAHSIIGKFNNMKETQTQCFSFRYRWCQH